jgi:hypothetical protein
MGATRESRTREEACERCSALWRHEMMPRSRRSARAAIFGFPTRAGTNYG